FLATASANRTWHRLMCAPVAGGVLAYRTLRLVASSAPGCPRAVRRWRSIHWTSSTTMVPSPCLECENRGQRAVLGGRLRLHDAIKGGAHGGVGPGLTPRQALQIGLRVDVDRLSCELIGDIKRGKVNLDDVGTTLALLRADSVVGVEGVFDGENLVGVGI